MNLDTQQGPSHKVKSAVAQIIRNLTKEVLCEQKRNEIDLAYFLDVHNLIEKCDEEILNEVLRFLRNSCAGCPRNQNAIRLTPSPRHFIKYLYEPYANISTLQLVLQFFGNFIQGNEENSTNLLDFIKHDLSLLETLIASSDNLISKYASFVTLNILRIFPAKMKSFSSGIQTVCENMDNEFCLIIIEELAGSNDFQLIYENLNRTTKMKVLEILDAAQLQKFNPKTIEFLVQTYQENADSILMLKPIEVEEFKLNETVRILKLLMHFIANNPNSELQSNTPMLISTLYLLKFFHEGSLMENSPFKIKEKLSDFEAILNNSDESEHFLGIEIKSILIRFIGNLVYQKKNQQDLFRRSDGIPLLFSSCRLDANNPTIIQNAVFTIRNLMEGNDENQKFVKEIMKKPIDQDESGYMDKINKVLFEQ